MIMAFTTPIKSASAIDKIDSKLVAMGLAKTDKVDVIVELDDLTVVSASTFDKNIVYSSKELMRPENVVTKYLEKKLVRVQNSNIDIVKTFSPEIKIGMQYQYALNGYFATVPLDAVEKIASLPGVRYVYYSEPMNFYRTRARVALGCEKIWSTLKDKNGRPVDGNGMLVGVTDSGLDYTHVDFGAQTSPVGPKVKISRDLAYKDNDCQEEENIQTVGHGTACAGIIAADGPFNKTTNVWEKGLAPKASLASYKLGMKDQMGLSGEGIMASWELNIKDKVDVSNNSYGGVGGRSFTDRAQENCIRAGCVVLAAQGNEGSPGVLLPIPCGTTSAPINVIAVAALDDTDAAKIEVVDAADESFRDNIYVSSVGNTGMQFTALLKQFDLVDCAWGRTVDFEGLDLNGKVALVQRGPSADLKAQFGDPITFKEKCENAAKAGAKAMLLYNYESSEIRAQYWDPANDDPKKLKLVPTFELSNYIQGYAIRDALHAGHDWDFGSVDKNQNKFTIQVKEIGRKGIVSTYSSSGPNYFGYLKPDVAAPADGTHTTAAYFMKKYFKSDYWEVFNGTSAATPMVSGCATLIKQGRPEWSPYEIKRALMNTAEPLKRLSGDYYVPMTVQGMGRVNAQSAILSNLLFQPASTLILAKSGKTNMTDPAPELYDDNAKASIPADVLGSRIPVKIVNYSNKPSKIGLSFEINSARPEQIGVNLTTTELTIPPADAKGNPGSAWFGVDVKLPEVVKGRLNDIYIWATDKSQNKKWHIGVCVYNQDPTVQGDNNSFVDELEVKTPYISPNGDGEDEVLEVNGEVSCGNFNVQSFDNYLTGAQIWVSDQNQERWIKIKDEPLLELGPFSFKWDGKDENGNYVLPDGNWSLQVILPCYFYNGQSVVGQWIYADLANSDFTIEKSPVPPLPTLSAQVLPLEPGVGQMFEVGLYLSHATDVKSIQFKINIPGGSSIVQYMGYDKGDFLIQDEPLALFTTDYDKDKETFDVSIQRPLDGVTGDGYILKLKFMAKDSNYFDIRFSDLILSMIGENGKETKTKAFYKNGEISILEKAYDPADFNRDGKVDDKDAKILQDCMDAKDGDTNYNWRCDLNYDRVIDVNDYTIFAKSYSKR